MPRLHRLLRPGLVVSVLAHGGLVAAGLWCVGAGPETRTATIAAFVSEEWSGAEDLEEVLPVVETRPLPAAASAPRPEEPVVAEEVPPELEAPAERAPTSEGTFLRVPVGLRTSRPRPSEPAEAAPAAAPTASAVPPTIAQAARRAGGGPTRGAVPLGNRKPAYPPEALARGWEGTVYLLVRVREDGAVGAVEVDESSGHAPLDEAALRTARAWRYEPRLVEGVPAPDLLRVPVVFRIRRAP